MILSHHKVLARKCKKVLKTLQNKIITKKDLRELQPAINAIGIIRTTLDDDYHREITDAQFKKLGHIYYGGKR